MSLFDEMEKKPTGYVLPEVEVKPKDVPTPKEAKVYPVHDAEAIKAASPIVEPAEQVKKPYTYWWQSPDYMGEVERRAATAEKNAEQEKKRLRRERNAAIISDIAKSAAQAYMLNGGVTEIERFAPKMEKVNDKLAALRERHAAEVAAFARERAVARQAQIADNNARMKLETSLEAEDAARRAKAEKEAREQAYKMYRDSKDDEYKLANLQLKEKNYNRIKSQGSGKNKGLIVTFPDGNRVEYSDDIQGDGSIYEAYEDLKAVGMPPLMGKRWSTDEEKWIDTGIEETNPARIRAHIKNWTKGGYKRGNNDAGIINDNNAGIL